MSIKENPAVLALIDWKNEKIILSIVPWDANAFVLENSPRKNIINDTKAKIRVVVKTILLFSVYFRKCSL